MTTLLILGATGQVGRHLLSQALADARVTRVVAPTRRALAADLLANSKLHNPVVDFRALPADAPWWRADAALSAFGTTLKQAGSKDAFVEIDHDFVLAAAKLARAAGTPTFVNNSSLGAKASSGNFYLGVKGRIEADLNALGFASVTHVRPSMLDVGSREEKRPGEGLGLALAKGLAPIIPKRWRAVRTDAVARSMIAAALAAKPGVAVLESEVLG